MCSVFVNMYVNMLTSITSLWFMCHKLTLFHLLTNTIEIHQNIALTVCPMKVHAFMKTLTDNLSCEHCEHVLEAFSILLLVAILYYR